MPALFNHGVRIAAERKLRGLIASEIDPQKNFERAK